MKKTENSPGKLVDKLVLVLFTLGIGTILVLIALHTLNIID